MKPTRDVGRLVSLALALAAAQALSPQTNTFNSTFVLSDSQMADNNLSAAMAHNINVALQFERSNWAPSGSVFADAFYTHLPANASSAPVGSPLKVEALTDTNGYTIAPTLALSRILYQSATLNGTRVPVSAYILWPYLRRSSRRGRVPLVSWGHGTSGIFPECAPSHVRNLWYQFSAPYQLALAGYAVVGSDYAGLGVPFDADGGKITHQYIASPASGNDLLYAARAAHAAFPDELTPSFVVMGHSQGGGAAWAAAQQQRKLDVPGYLGAIAASPVTNAIELGAARGSNLGLLQIASSILSVYPRLALSDILTPRGVRLLTLLEQVQACSAVFHTLLAEILTADPRAGLVRDDFVRSPTAARFQKLVVAGGKDVADPMLDEPGVSEPTIRYVKAKGVDHMPILFATQQIWLDWLDERFASAGDGDERIDKGKGKGKGEDAEAEGRYAVHEVGDDTPQPLDHYQRNLNYFLEYSLDDYQLA
ncbi:hypothetical protein DCS_00176 [Drechmeria coniospora]|uniref:Secretory lipase n=1 Tax=Drechmeria coniospora TaxID=98403 RepID=A0A151GPL3_DRECN|nr:hypothetical protein DCS_00176 [Drechmeria coniospora]KYK59049.1 hypothetical protein DCS_00176 [Drechmeria coniospora]